MAARKCGLRLGILLLGSFLPAVLVKFGADAVILKGPENITAPIGAVATFHCLAQGDDAFWEINDTAIEYPEDRASFTEKGFMFSETINYDTYNFTMMVNALPGNNNTRITCLVYPRDDNNFPGSLTVIVPQPPPSPKPQLLVLNATTIQLSWLPPFSWAEYPIVNYSVQVYNRATGEVMNSFINATSEVLSTTAPVTFTYNTPQGEVMQNCEELVFIVSAASTIGWGSPAIVTGGFPIVPTLDTNITSIKSTVTFQLDGTPLLLLNIQPPEICPFQEPSYSIIIQHISPTLNNVSDAGGVDDIIAIGPKAVMGCTNVYEVVESGLVEDAVYSVLVHFDSFAGNVSSITTFTTATSFNTATPSLCPCSSKGEHSQPTTDYPGITATAGAGRHSQPTTITESTNITATGAAGISLVEKIAMSVSISLVITIVSAIMLLLVCGFIYWRRTSVRSISCNFDNEECESIQPEQKSLTTPHPTADVMEPHYGDSPTNQAELSEMAKASAKDTALAVAGGPSERSGDENKARWAISDADSKDKYIIMNPVRTLTSSLHGGWDDPHSELPKQEQF